MKITPLSLIAAALSTLMGCNMVDMSTRPTTLVQPTPVYAGLGKPWPLYDESLTTGGGLDFFSGGTFTGLPVIDLANKSNPYSGTNCWKFSVPAQTGGWFCGVQLLQGQNYADSAAKPATDLSAPGFTQCVFYARTGAGTTQVKFEAFSDGVVFGGGANPNNLTVNITPSWQKYTIPLVNGAHMHDLKHYFTIIFANSAPTTATPIDLFIDALRYE